MLGIGAGIDISGGKGWVTASLIHLPVCKTGLKVSYNITSLFQLPQNKINHRWCTWLAAARSQSCCACVKTNQLVQQRPTVLTCTPLACHPLPSCFNEKRDDVRGALQLGETIGCGCLFVTRLPASQPACLPAQWASFSFLGVKTLKHPQFVHPWRWRGEEKRESSTLVQSCQRRIADKNLHSSTDPTTSAFSVWWWDSDKIRYNVVTRYEIYQQNQNQEI